VNAVAGMCVPPDRMPRLLAALAVVLCLVAPAHAKLAPSTITDLLAESELIAQVNVTEATAQYAVVEIVEVLKGTKPDQPIRIEFSQEEHEQTMAATDQRLVFLKKRDGKWTGTHYGRSYWPLAATSDKKAALATPYIYPMTMVRFDKADRGMLAKAKFAAKIKNPNASWEGAMKQMIRLSAIASAVKPK
jgi:hypothetical protein